MPKWRVGPGRHNLPVNTDMTGEDISAEQAEALRQALARLRASGLFEQQPRSLSLLNYLAEAELSGRGDTLNAYTVAFDFLGKSSDFDPGKDSSVRVALHKLRTALRMYATANPDVWPKIEIPKASYRPVLVPAPASHSGRRDKGRLPIIAGGTLLVITLAGIGWVAGLGRSAAPCRADRPVLFMNVAPADYGSNIEAAEFVTDLEYVLSTYPLVGMLTARSGCMDVPTYDLNLNIQDTDGDMSVRAEIVAREDAELVWSRHYSEAGLGEAAEYSGTGILAARLAYDIGHQERILPNDALKRHWANEDDEDAYRCVMSAHHYFVSPAEEEGKEVVACLAEVAVRDNAHSDTLVLLAAMLDDLDAYSSEPASEATRARIGQLMEAAAEQNPNCTELLIMRLRLARLAQPVDHTTIANLLERIRRDFNGNPNIMNQAAQALGFQLGEWETALEFDRRAKDIAITHRGFNHLALQAALVRADADTALDLSVSFRSTDYIFDKVLLLATYQLAEDQEGFTAVVQELRALDIGQKDQLLMILDERNLHSSIRTVLSSAIQKTDLE